MPKLSKEMGLLAHKISINNRIYRLAEIIRKEVGDIEGSLYDYGVSIYLEDKDADSIYFIKEKINTIINNNEEFVKLFIDIEYKINDVNFRITVNRGDLNYIRGDYV